MSEDQNGTQQTPSRSTPQERDARERLDSFVMGQMSNHLGEIDRTMTEFKALAIEVKDNQGKIFTSLGDIGDGMAEMRDEQSQQAKKIERLYTVLTVADGMSSGVKKVLPLIGIASGLYAFYEWVTLHVIGKQ